MVLSSYEKHSRQKAACCPFQRKQLYIRQSVLRTNSASRTTALRCKIKLRLWFQTALSGEPCRGAAVRIFQPFTYIRFHTVPGVCTGVKKPLTAFGKTLAPIGSNLGVQLYAVLFRPLTHIQRFQQMREAPQVFDFMQQVGSNKNSNLQTPTNLASAPFPNIRYFLKYRFQRIRETPQVFGFI